jgi:hypothetical protein
MSNYKEKICQLCSIVYKPTSPRQRYCIKCKDKAAKHAQKLRDKKRNRLRHNKVYVKECPVCKLVFETHDSKKIYCGAEKCDLVRRKINANKVDQKRNIKRKLERKRNKYKKIANTLKEIKKYVEDRGYELIKAPKYKNSSRSKLLLKRPSGSLWETTFNNFKSYSNNKDNKCLKYNLSCDYISDTKNKVRALLKTNFPEIKVRYNDRTLIKPQELDFYIPDYNLAIEVCDLYNHSENKAGKPRSYHYDKMISCYNKDVRLITIFEDELLEKQDIVFSRIRQALHKPSIRIFARKCTIQEIDSKTANTFFKENHIQGRSTAVVRYGLYYGEALVAVGSAGKLIRAHTNKEKTLELKRFCTLKDVFVVGGAGKLFKAIKNFAEENGYTVIKSYCDMRYANIVKPVYEVLGFTLDGYTKYTPHYIKNKKRYRNFSLRKTPEERLTGKTEWELRKAQGYDRIWDCGHRTYVFNIHSKNYQQTIN